MRLNKLIIFTAFVFLWTQSSAQITEFTLDECMLYAIENSPVTAAQKARINISRQDYREALASLLPSVSASSSGYFFYGRSIGDDNIYRDENTFSNDYGIDASLIIFDGLSSIHRMKMHKINRIAGTHQLQVLEDELAYNTMEAFFNVQYYMQTVALAEEQLAESDRNAARVERMSELGLTGFPDVAEMHAKQAEDSYNLTRQKNLLALAIIVLKEKMNFPVDAELAIVPYEESMSVRPSVATASTLSEISFGSLPQALLAETTVAATEMAYRTAKGGIYPTLTLNGGISTNFFRPDKGEYSPFRTQFRDKRTEYIGLSLSVPIFNGLSRSSEKARSRYRLEIAKRERDQTLRTLYSEIEQAVSDMNGQAKEYEQARKQAKAMTVAHEANQRKYEQGLVSALELHTSANRVLSARIEQEYSLMKYYMKRRLVNYYSGEPFVIR